MCLLSQNKKDDCQENSFENHNFFIHWAHRLAWERANSEGFISRKKFFLMAGQHWMLRKEESKRLISVMQSQGLLKNGQRGIYLCEAPDEQT